MSGESSGNESEDFDQSDQFDSDDESMQEDEEETMMSHILTSNDSFVDTKDVLDSLKEKKKGFPYLTKYEKTKIIGLRAQQLANGSPPFVKIPQYITDTCQIANLELQQRKLPFMIKRGLPNGKNEYWKLSDMIYFD